MSVAVDPVRPSSRRRWRAVPASWVRRVVTLGAVLGLGLELLGQVAIELGAGDALQASIGQRVLGVTYATAGWMLAALAVALLTDRWRRWSVGRGAALTLVVSLLAGGVLVSLLGLAVRVISGSFLTAGAIEFALASSDHFARAAVGTYRGWLVLFSVLAVGTCAALAAWLYPARTSRPTLVAHRRLRLAAAVVMALLVAGVFVRRGDAPLTRGLFRSTPLLALVSSLDGGTAIAERLSADQAVGSRAMGAQGLVHEGPPMSAGVAWQALAKRRESQGGQQTPNVVLVLLESVGPQHLGFGGNPRPVTPEMDRLAKDGWRFHRVWSTATHSNYAQPAVLSALFPYRRTTLDQYHRLDYPRLLFHDLMHQLGYDTAIISSQDETWQGIHRYQQTGTPTFHRHAVDHPGPHIDTGAERIVPDELTTDLVLSWLTEPRDRPWAIYINFQTTHFPYTIPEHADHPYQPSEPDRGSYTYVGYPEADRPKVRNRFDNALTYVDEQIGRVRRYLEDTDEFANTLWVITSDHGEQFGEHGMVTHGRSLYDAEARVPLLLSWPGVIESADRYEPTSHLDVLPSIAELLGVPPHPSFQGSSFAQDRPATGSAPAIFLTIQGWRYADAIVCWPWKLIVERTGERILLFHLERDPQELDNLVDDHPTITARLGQVLDGQLRAQLDYYDSDATTRESRFAPRLSSCPMLPAAP